MDYKICTYIYIYVIVKFMIYSVTICHIHTCMNIIKYCLHSGCTSYINKIFSKIYFNFNDISEIKVKSFSVPLGQIRPVRIPIFCHAKRMGVFNSP